MVSYKLVHNRKNKVLTADETALIQVELYQNGKRRYITTNTYVTAAQWNDRKQEVKNNRPANHQLQQQLAGLREFEIFFPKQHGRPCNLDDFSLYLTAQSAALVPALSFSAYMLAEVEAERATVTLPVTWRKLRTLQQMRDHLGRDTMMEDLTYGFLVKFDQALRTHFELNENTVESVHNVLKQYANRAVKCGLLKQSPYDQFKYRGKTVDKAILSEEEISRLEALTFGEEQTELALCRDAFLLAYYTMLRISDVTSLTPRQLFETEAGLEIEKTQKKTVQLVRIPLGTLHGGKAQVILRRYWPPVGTKSFFPRTHPHLNRTLKKLLKMAAITKENVGFHTARHSGITSLVRRGITLPIVQRLAGHADLKMTMQYVHLAGSDVEKELGNITNW
jgi:integrase